MIAPIVVGLIWRYLLDARNGVVNYYLEAIGNALPFLQAVGFERQSWLGDPDLAMVSIVVSDVWQWTPFIFMIVLAGLQGLPGSTVEAARIDGASWPQETWYVKLPMMRNILLIALLDADYRRVSGFGGHLYHDQRRAGQLDPGVVAAAVSDRVYVARFRVTPRPSPYS